MRSHTESKAHMRTAARKARQRVKHKEHMTAVAVRRDKDREERLTYWTEVDRLIRKKMSAAKIRKSLSKPAVTLKIE